jgi:pilus assembly protein Flp/PilA
MEMLKRLWNEEEGQGMVEYGLIIALIAVGLIIALGLMGTSLEGIFDQIAAALDAA